MHHRYEKLLISMMYCEIRNRVFGRNVENMFYILSHFSSRAMWTCRRKKYLQERIKIHKHRDIAEMEENRTPEASVSSFQASSTLITFYFLYTKYDELSHTLFYTHFSIFFSILAIFPHFSHSFQREEVGGNWKIFEMLDCVPRRLEVRWKSGVI